MAAVSSRYGWLARAIPLLAACSSPPKAPPVPPALAPSSSSSPAPSVPAFQTPAPHRDAPEGREEQLLQLAGSGETLGVALNFRTSSLLTTSNHGLELGPRGLSPGSSNAARELVGYAVLASSGTFPERAYLLTPEYVSCTMPDKNVIRRWNGKRWAPLATKGPETWPQEQVIDLCSWGSDELALRLSSWNEHPVRSRFEVIEGGKVAPPVFEPSPNTPAHGDHDCQTRLLAQRCVGLPSGTVVVAGTACDESGPAVEYFSPGSVAGKLLALPRPVAAGSFELTHVSANDEVVYVAGRQGSPQRGYLVRFSPRSGAELILLPKSAQTSLIRDLVATRDGSLWLNASPQVVQDGVVSMGLWRRDPGGVWHRQSLPPGVPAGPQAWQLSPGPSDNLFQAWGEVWLDATFYDGQPEQPGTQERELIFGARAGMTPLVWHKKPGASRPVSAPPAPLPCGP